MGLQDRDYYWEKHNAAQRSKPKRFFRSSRNRSTAHQPPDLMDVLKRIPVLKVIFVLVILGCAGLFIYPFV